MEVIKINEGLFFLDDLAQDRHAQFHTYYYILRLFSGLTSKTQNLSKGTGRSCNNLDLSYFQGSLMARLAP